MRDLWPDGKFVTANILVRTDYLQNNQDVIKKFLTSHVDETQWINTHQDEAIKQFNIELKKLTGQNSRGCSKAIFTRTGVDMGSYNIIINQVRK